MLVCPKVKSRKRTRLYLGEENTSGRDITGVMTIQVFKTSLSGKEDIARVKPHLESLSGLIEWSVDRSDCDNVLRVAGGSNIKVQKIIAIIRAKGYECEILL